MCIVSGRFGSDFNGQKVDDGNGIAKEEREKNAKQQTTHHTNNMHILNDKSF